jgi:hypothetical protein
LCSETRPNAKPENVMCNYMYKIFYILLVLIALSFRNKQTSVIEGVVVDFDSKKPIFSVIYLNYNAYYTDSLGVFRIEYNKLDYNSILFSSIHHFDTEINTNEKIDTIFLISQNVKEGKYCGQPDKILKCSYDRPLLENQNYRFTYLVEETHFDTIKIKNKIKQIIISSKPERYFQLYK